MLQIITSKTRPDTFMPEGKKIWSPHPGLVLFSGVLWDVKLRELYDRLYHGRVAPSVLFRALDGTTLLAAHDPAVQTGTWPSGTILKYENHGRIQGIGGKGGDGSTLGCFDGHDGGDGGDAFLIEYDLELDNTDGEIFSGGGGGGGGGGYSSFEGDIVGGSGGGGGAGAIPGAGGDIDSCDPGQSDCHEGEPGDSGASDSGGAGGDIYSPDGVGGDGGAPGESGQNGTGIPKSGLDDPCEGTTGGTGGAAGNAITQSGGTVTITGGNNSTQIKGSVV